MASTEKRKRQRLEALTRLRVRRDEVAEDERDRRRKKSAEDVAINDTKVWLKTTRPGAGVTSMVMMSWEAPYMEALVEALEIQGNDNVLEIGYGLGMSARAIAKKVPASHDVLEIAPAVIQRAGDVAKPTTIIPDSWQHFLRTTTNKYDAVFFDDFPLDDGFPPSTSRWIDFLHALHPVLHHRARISGYLAHTSALDNLPPGYSLASMTPFPLIPPPDCPYHGVPDRCLVPLLRFHRPSM